MSRGPFLKKIIYPKIFLSVIKNNITFINISFKIFFCLCLREKSSWVIEREGGKRSPALKCEGIGNLPA